MEVCQGKLLGDSRVVETLTKKELEIAVRQFPAHAVLYYETIQHRLESSMIQDLVREAPEVALTKYGPEVGPFSSLPELFEEVVKATPQTALAKQNLHAEEFNYCIRQHPYAALLFQVENLDLEQLRFCLDAEPELGLELSKDKKLDKRMRAKIARILKK